MVTLEELQKQLEIWRGARKAWDKAQKDYRLASSAYIKAVQAWKSAKHKWELGEEYESLGYSQIDDEGKMVMNIHTNNTKED